jgi:hypothetical protein
MAATVGTVASPGTIAQILKDYYIDGIEQQLNNEVMCLEMFEKAKVSWAGRQAIIPCHVGRNTGVAFANESGTLPTAGNQTIVRLSVESKYLYGRFSVTGQAIASAAQGGTASFINALDLEMDGLKTDIRNRSDESCVSGGSCVGFIHHNALTTAQDADATGIKFEGNAAKLATLVASGTLTVNLVCLGNSQLGVAAGAFVGITPAAAFTGTITDLAVSAVDATAGTITLTPTSAAINTTGVPNGVPMAIVIKTYTASAAPLQVYDPDKEPTGIFSNMSTISHWGVLRSGAPTADGETELQGVHLAMDTDGGNDRAALSLERMQEVLDAVSVVSGEDPDVILVNPAMRAKYIALLDGNIQSFGDKATKGDGGFLGLSFANIPIKTGRHIPQGLMIFLKTKSWKLAVLEDGKFADMDGNVLSRVSDRDAWEGFYKWYYDHYCLRPGANAILSGIICGTLAA